MKYVKSLLIIFFLFICTGCVNYDMKMQINNDKSMVFTLDETIDQNKYDELDINNDEFTNQELKEIQLYTKNNFDNVKSSMEYRGYTVYNNINTKNKEIKITRRFNNIDDISKEGNKRFVDLSTITDNSFDDRLFFSVKKGYLYNTYTGLFTFNKPNIKANKLDKYKNNFIINYQVELPTKSLKSNATSKSNNDKSLLWKIDMNSNNNIEYSFKIANLTNFYILYGIIGFNILILIILIIIVIKIINNESSNNMNNPKDIILQQRNESLKEVNNQFKNINPENTVPKIIKPIDNSIIVNKECNKNNINSVELLEESTLIIPEKKVDEENIAISNKQNDSLITDNANKLSDKEK